VNRRVRYRALPAFALILGLVATGCGGDKNAGGDARPAGTAPATTQPAAADGMSTVAHAKVSSVKVFAKPGDTAAPTHTFANPTKIGGPLVFLMEKAEGDWLLVNLPVRPNGSTGWVKASDVTLTQNDYKIIVELNAHKITVLKGANTVLSEKVGVGRGNAPTPGGKFYIKELLQPPNPNTVYGPYAYGLSGFSESFETFNGNEPVLGIHGNDDPSTLGKDVSAGCIRMSNDGITKLAQILPLGVPVEIIK